MRAARVRLGAVRSAANLGAAGLGILIFASLAAPHVQAKDVPAAMTLTPGQAAMSGYWHNITPPGQPFSPTPPDVIAKMQPWVASIYAKDTAASAAGDFVPNPNTACMPSAVGGTGSSGGLAYSAAIAVEPRQVSFFYELNRGIRFAYVGQLHPAKLSPSWQGHSIAHWEGDTLVVDTLGFNDKNRLMLGANLKTQSTDNIPMSSKMHVVERYTVLANGQLEDIATFDDPGAFTAPFTLTTHFSRAQPFQEYICAENNHEGGVPTASGGVTGFTLPKPPS